jgi:hypothetical protein
MRIKKILSIALDSLLALLVFTIYMYVLGCIIHLDFNPAHWGELSRTILTIGAIAMSGFTVREAYRAMPDPNEKFNA